METPIDRIRQERPLHEAAETPPSYSWNTVKKVVDEFPHLSEAQAGDLPANLQKRWKELQPTRSGKGQEAKPARRNTYFQNHLVGAGLPSAS